MFSVLRCGLDEIMFRYFLSPNVSVTQRVLWALTFSVPFQETEGKQNLSFLPNERTSGFKTSVGQQGSVCNCGRIGSSILFSFCLFFF